MRCSVLFFILEASCRKGWKILNFSGIAPITESRQASGRQISCACQKGRTENGIVQEREWNRRLLIGLILSFALSCAFECVVIVIALHDSPEWCKNAVQCCCPGGGERKIIYSSQRNFYLSVLSSLSRVSLPPPFGGASYCHFTYQRHGMYAVFMLCTMLRFHVTCSKRTDALSRLPACVCVSFQRVFRRCFLLLFCIRRNKKCFSGQTFESLRDWCIVYS